MKEIDKILESRYSSNELTTLATKLDKEFKVNFFWNGWEMLQREVFCEKEINIFKNKYRDKEIYNHIIMKYGKNETIIKYNLIKEFIKDSSNVGLMEFNVGNSRLDIGRINENLYAYEIKTELDNTVRLNKQIEDYEKIFEFIYVVCHCKHLKNVRASIPKKVGILVFEIYDEKVIFKFVRRAQKNRSIRKEFILESINSREYEFIIKKYLEINKVPLYRQDRAKLVDRKINKRELLDIYKKMLRLRQIEKWNRIKEDFNAILPIELQDIYSKDY